MKYRLAIFVFVLIPISLFSQKTVIEKNIDSLAFEISNNAENDIALSNELAFLLIHSGRIHEAKSMLTKTILQEFKHGISDTAAYLQAIDLYGEIYYYLRDFNKAMDIWSQNYQIKKKYFGTESIFLAESYCKFAKFHNFKIDIDTAFYYAEKAKMMLENAEENELVLINVPEILKTYAYAYKISFSRVYNNNDNRISCFLKVIEILDSAISYQHPLNLYYEADYVHDKANCYTDMVCFLYCEKIIPDHPFISLLYCKQEALSLYSEEYAIRNKVNNNPLFMITLFFTKALVTGYASNDIASIKNCISYCDSAIAIASNSNSNRAYDNILQENLLIANTLGVRHFKSGYLKTLYQNDTTNIDYLYRMHENAKQSFEYFVQLLNSLHTQKLGSLFQRYNMLQFDLLYYADMELFRQTKDTAYLEMALIHSQFSKNLDIAQAKFKGYPISPVYFPPALEKWKEYTKNNPKTVVIDYFIFGNKISIILLKNGKISHHYVETAINENYYAFASEIKHKKETINGITDFWYKIIFEEQQGWVFGSQTSLKMENNRYNTEIPSQSNTSKGIFKGVYMGYERDCWIVFTNSTGQEQSYYYSFESVNESEMQFILLSGDTIYRPWLNIDQLSFGGYIESNPQLIGKEFQITYKIVDVLQLNNEYRQELYFISAVEINSNAVR